MTSKKQLSERDICTQYINPALQKAGWDMFTQVREEVSFTDGRIYVKGNLTTRGKQKRADYILYYPNPDIETRIRVQSLGRYSECTKYVVTLLVISYFLHLLDVLRGCAIIVFSISGFGYYKPNIPIAIIEAKNNQHSVNAGIQQGLNYAKILDIPSVYSSNGDGFYEHDRTNSTGKIEKELSLNEFPSPFELWQRYKKYKGKLITGSLKDYTRKKVRKQYQSLNDFLSKWHKADKKQLLHPIRRSCPQSTRSTARQIRR